MKLRKFITLATAGTATAGLSLLGLGVGPMVRFKPTGGL